MNDPVLRIIDELRMPDGLDLLIRQALCLCFPADAAAFSKTRGWHGSKPAFTIVLESGEGEVIAHAGVVERRVRMGSETVRVAGIQNVCVVPAQRGRQFADRTLSAATREAAERGFDLGLLFCVPELAPLYLRSGWKPVEGRRIRYWNEKGDEDDALGKNRALFHPMKIREIPPGEIHLQGPDW